MILAEIFLKCDSFDSSVLLSEHKITAATQKPADAGCKHPKAGIRMDDKNIPSSFHFHPCFCNRTPFNPFR